MPVPELPTALSIAGSDPTGGAGLQLDLQVFALHGVHGMAVPTALTVQATTGVLRSLPVFPGAVREQLVALLADIRPHALKLGMLATDDVLLAVADAIESSAIPRVVDPVLRATSGAWLLERRAFGNLCERLICGAALVTPNLEEAELLTGQREPAAAAEALLAMGAHAVLIKGGHAEGAPDDLLATPQGSSWLRGTRQPHAPHGTGCALSSAITARLARGEELANSVAGAKRWLERAIGAAVRVGRGRALLDLRAAPAT
jgi:hydroxymethylpyrimidine/phosphomethylpyrimidine kinase